VPVVIRHDFGQKLQLTGIVHEAVVFGQRVDEIGKFQAQAWTESVFR
jgi:hypothetical protein